jgi:hypothetical protein
MTWVLGRGGQILYKAMWTSAARVEDFLTRYEQQPLDLTHGPFHTEQIEIRQRDEDAFQQGLARNGPRAVAEFARAGEIWKQRLRDTRRQPEHA